ncbi:hypothetical protein AB0H88_04120 [Nonomuraea sp. NPDC050680]|uniref:TRADD-N-associated membrane domain-containing protein n=1 Tax=Nonomuraea sp. NPDC050680 TaxID=3154630 RepID=UPI0033C00F3E
MTHKRLDYYHQIATSQARRSFWMAQVAMAAGFIELGVLGYFALNASTLSATVVTGVLGTASAAFGAYISRTFIRSQESSALHLRAYFNQPLEFSRYLAAERFLNAVGVLPEAQRATVVADLLHSMTTQTRDAQGETTNTAEEESARENRDSTNVR